MRQLIVDETSLSQKLTRFGGATCRKLGRDSRSGTTLSTLFLAYAAARDTQDAGIALHILGLDDDLECQPETVRSEQCVNRL